MRSKNRQGELFSASLHPRIAIQEDHPLLRMTDEVDWTELEERAEAIRGKKVKSPAGRTPHLRVMLAAVVLMAIRRLSYRDAEDQIRHYAPARYLCRLTETDWTPDFTTIQDFTEMMGEEGMRLINESVVNLAVDRGLADPSVMVADTTAQEAAIPYPNEMGLMSSFVRSVSSWTRRAGGLIRAVGKRVAGKVSKAKTKLREYRLFAKTKPRRLKLLKQMSTLVEGMNREVGRALNSAGGRFVGVAKRAERRLASVHETMNRLLPQIRYWIRTGRVAKGKIVSLHIPELYAIVRGKVGKAVEFGLSWGIRRLRGGFLMATMGLHRRDVLDSRFVLGAVGEHAALFGKPPSRYGYDRGGYGSDIVLSLKKRGVRHVAVAPRGQAAWAVGGRIREEMIRERSLVEGSIGAVKSARYGFNRPGARSAAMMGACGQRAVLGFNLNKLVRGLARRELLAAAA